MIQWCMDCKYDYGQPTEDLNWCTKCLNSSRPGEVPWGYETCNYILVDRKEMPNGSEKGSDGTIQLSSIYS